MTLLPPSVPSLATSPTTMPRASSFWRSACLLWPTSSPKGLTCQGWLWCDRCLSKTSHLWSRRWQSRGNDFRTLNKVLAEDDKDEVLKHYYIRVGGNLRALDLILEDVSREGQKGADAVIEQVEQWYNRRVEPIEKKLDDQEVKNYLLKVAEAGPMGYLPNSKQTTQMTLNLLREEPADCVLRSTTNLRVAVKHWHFVAKLFEEDEQKLRDAGYMWASPVKNCGAWDVLWVSHPRVIFTYCMHNRRYPTLVSMKPRYQYLTINDTQNLVSIIPRYQYLSINDTPKLV